ncbi:MAG: hypothetical protein E7170_02105 [Firmicutes bacterium]|nr:hypothetical protein [Bacillota bacterium]
MSAKETLELLSKQWCDLNDLMKLTNVGRNSALKIRKEIKVELEDKGYTLPNNLLPMCEVVNKLRINIPYLQKMSKLETQ